MSISIACGRSRRARGLGGRKRIPGNSICPARSSISNKPRQTMSRGAPLACFHCQASQSFSDNLRRLAVGWSVINLRMKSISSAVTVRPRYLHSGILFAVWQSRNWNARGLAYFFYALTCRHTGGASASGFAAASSNCAWCARRVRAGSEPLGHHLKRPFDSRFVASQNPWPS